MDVFSRNPRPGILVFLAIHLPGRKICLCNWRVWTVKLDQPPVTIQPGPHWGIEFTPLDCRFWMCHNIFCSWFLLTWQVWTQPNLKKNKYWHVCTGSINAISACAHLFLSMLHLSCRSSHIFSGICCTKPRVTNEPNSPAALEKIRDLWATGGNPNSCGMAGDPKNLGKTWYF